MGKRTQRGTRAFGHMAAGVTVGTTVTGLVAVSPACRKWRFGCGSGSAHTVAASQRAAAGTCWDTAAVQGDTAWMGGHGVDGGDTVWMGGQSVDRGDTAWIGGTQCGRASHPATDRKSQILPEHHSQVQQTVCAQLTSAALNSYTSMRCFIPINAVLQLQVTELQNQLASSFLSLLLFC